MRNGRSLGAVLADLAPAERDEYHSLIETGAEKEVATKRASHKQKVDSLNECKAEVKAEKVGNGNPSSTVVREHLGRERFSTVLLVICLVGEWVFAVWCIGPFGLGQWETCLVAATIVIILLEGVHHFLSWLNQAHLLLHNRMRLVMVCAGMVLIFAMIYLISEIRGILFQITTVLSNSPDLETKATQGAIFFKGASVTFKLLMAVLTSAITIIGGLSFHQTKERLFKILQLRRLEKEEKALDHRILLENQGIVFEDTKLQIFLQEVEDGLYAELARQNRRKKGLLYRLMERLIECLKPGLTAARVAAFSMVVLILVTSLFLLTALARGETITLLDLSISVEVRGYAGGDTEFQRNVKGVQALIENIPRGEPFKVFAITERTFSQPWLLLGEMITTEKGYFGEREAQQRLALIKKWKGLRLKPVAGATDIFGALHLAASLFNGNPGRKNLVFFSDMRQNTQELNLEKFSVIDAEAVIKEVTRRTPVPSLNGVRVWCLGVHSASKTPAYWNSLKNFWEKYFRLANASRLEAFSMERKLNFEGF